MPDKFASYSASLESPGEDSIEITPSDSGELATWAKAIWVGGTGNVTIVTAAGNVRTFSNVQAGSILPMRARRVNATGTTATLMQAII